MHPDDVAELVAEQVTELRRQVADLPQLGVTDITVVGQVDVRISLPLRLLESQVAQAVDGLSLPGQPRLYNVPILGRYQQRPVIVRMVADGFDSQPPTAELWDQQAQPLSPELWPREASGGGIVGGYSLYPRPFFCRPGLREFHDHPEHENEPWDKYREGFTLHGIALGLLNDLGVRWVMGG